MITLTLTEQDVNALKGFIDATLRACGYSAIDDAARLKVLLDQAQQAAQEAAQKEPE